MVISSSADMGNLPAPVAIFATFSERRPGHGNFEIRNSKFEIFHEVSGVFKGNGHEANLAYVSIAKGEPLADKPTLIIVFSDGKFGSALVITVNNDGEIVGCKVAHAAHQKGAFNSIGTMKMSHFKLEGGKIQGKLSSGGERETFGQKWEVDLRFQAIAP